MRRSNAHIVNVVLLIGLFGGGLLVFDTLPEQIPRHFGVRGVADAYWAATPLHWMVLPFVALFTTVALYGSAWLIGRRPAAMNVPNRAAYQALPPTDQKTVVAIAQRYVYWMAAAIIVLMADLQYAVYQVARSSTERLPMRTVVVLVITVVGILISAFWLRRHLRQTIERLRTDAP